MRDPNSIFDRLPWDESLTPEQREWWDWVLEESERRERFPSWTLVQESWKREFPGTEVPNEKKIKRYLIRNLTETGRGEWI